ncbi:Ubiquitin domain-containing protein ubfd1 [Nowakowskiella sp. JEL0078]|nr:Ubiquitin domain-containing protein ubfd1 [Nowakowskiella sp. JEL0078]
MEAKLKTTDPDEVNSVALVNNKSESENSAAVAVDSDQTELKNESQNETSNTTNSPILSFKVSFGKQIIPFQMPASNTIAELKTCLEKEIGVSASLQKLLLKGVLKDELTLELAKVKDGVKIVLMGSKAEDVLKIATSVPVTSVSKSVQSVKKVSLSELIEHKKILDKGLPDDAEVGIKGNKLALPERGLFSLLNRQGIKTRLTFKNDSQEVWIGTAERTQKLRYDTIRGITSEPILGREEYHILTLQLGPTEKSNYYLYYVPAQYIESIKDTILGRFAGLNWW